MLAIGKKIYVAASLLKRDVGKEVRPANLTMLHGRVLDSLVTNGQQTQKQLGASLKASAMSISDVVERLQSLGYVNRMVHPRDSRAKLVEITEDGIQRRIEFRAAAERLIVRAMDGISPEDLAAAERVMDRIIENLQPDDCTYIPNASPSEKD